MADFKKELRVAREIAHGAGKLLMKGRDARKKVSKKGRVDLVTEYDLRADKYITSHLLKAFPQYAILSEEGGGIKRKGSHQWVIDPLDGTTNFAHDYPVFCVSIALEVDNEMAVGVIYDPNFDEMFYAAKGGGAFCNRRRMKVSTESKLENSLLATGFPYDIGESRVNNLGHFGRMYKAAQGIRRAGSAALDLAYLAYGRFDGFWELKLHPWDCAAGVLMVEEAGGLVTRINGGKYSIYDDEILASNRRIHKQMQKVLVRM